MHEGLLHGIGAGKHLAARTPNCHHTRCDKERAVAAARQIMLPNPLVLWSVCVACMFVFRVSLSTRTLCISACTDVAVIWYEHEICARPAGL